MSSQGKWIWTPQFFCKSDLVYCDNRSILPSATPLKMSASLSQSCQKLMINMFQKTTACVIPVSSQKGAIWQYPVNTFQKL